MSASSIFITALILAVFLALLTMARRLRNIKHSFELEFKDGDEPPQITGTKPRKQLKK